MKYLYFLFFFFSSRRRHTRYWRDWSSDVCSSDLLNSPSGESAPPRMPRPRPPRISGGSAPANDAGVSARAGVDGGAGVGVAAAAGTTGAEGGNAAGTGTVTTCTGVAGLRSASHTNRPMTSSSIPPNAPATASCERLSTRVVVPCGPMAGVAADAGVTVALCAGTGTDGVATVTSSGRG